MAAFRLASKGRSIGESSYETERESILALLNMQRPSSNHQQTKFDIQPENFVSTKFVKKYKTKQVRCFFLLIRYREVRKYLERLIIIYESSPKAFPNKIMHYVGIIN
jgi:negative regulator of replication initiation